MLLRLRLPLYQLQDFRMLGSEVVEDVFGNVNPMLLLISKVDRAVAKVRLIRDLHI